MNASARENLDRHLEQQERAGDIQQRLDPLRHEKKLIAKRLATAQAMQSEQETTLGKPSDWLQQQIHKLQLLLPVIDARIEAERCK